MLDGSGNDTIDFTLAANVSLNEQGITTHFPYEIDNRCTVIFGSGCYDDLDTCFRKDFGNTLADSLSSSSDNGHLAFEII
ncbi:hypothetical protein D9M68_834600 [compost metagenome]